MNLHNPLFKRGFSCIGGKVFMFSYIRSIFQNRTTNNTEVNLDTIKSKTLPTHIAIIMDGNGRWANLRGLPRAVGHRAGLEALKRTVETCTKIGIKYLTVYAFSTENWKRPKDEVDALMNLLIEYIQKELDQLHQNGIRVSTLGKLEELPLAAQEQIKHAIKRTQNNTKLHLQIAINYGGRTEIVEAIREITKATLKGQIKPEEINEETVSKYLYTANIPDPDLMIRPSGELRVSNFLLWQLAYTEFWVTNILWPDFKAQHLYQAINAYQNRHRRYGGL